MNTLEETVENTKEDTMNSIQENLIKDIKKDTKALYYALKYLDPKLNIFTDDFLEKVVEAKKFAIQYVPEERITDNMIWTLIRGKNPRYLNHIPKERITNEMEDEIINTFTIIGLQSYLRYKGEDLNIESVKRIVLKTKKIYRQYLRRYIPAEFLVDEIRILLNDGEYTDEGIVYNK